MSCRGGGGGGMPLCMSFDNSWEGRFSERRSGGGGGGSCCGASSLRMVVTAAWKGPSTRTVSRPI